MTIELADKTVRDTFSAGFEHLATVVVVFSFFATVVFGIFIIDVEEGFESLGRDEPELLGAVLPHAASRAIRLPAIRTRVNLIFPMVVKK